MGCGSSQPSSSHDVELQVRPVPQGQRGRQHVGPGPRTQDRSSSARPGRWTPPGEAVSLEGYRSSSQYRVPRQIPGSDSIDSHNSPLLDRNQLLQALEITASHLRSKALNYTIVTLGGSLNTILLRTRSATQDVDFFTADISTKDLNNIEEAANYTVRKLGPKVIGNAWLNNQVLSFIPLALSRTLLQRAIRQNVIVFNKPGLKVLASPWSYSFTAKAERMLQSNVKDFDIDDCAHYLHQYIISHENRPVTIQLFKQWADEYGRRSSNYVIKEINTVYRDHYHKDAVQELIGTPDFRPYANLKTTGR